MSDGVFVLERSGGYHDAQPIIYSSLNQSLYSCHGQTCYLRNSGALPSIAEALLLAQIKNKSLYGVFG